MTQSELSASEQLTHSTVRIEADLATGDQAVGTGYYFAFLRDGEKSIPAIITNKHVVETAQTGRFHLQLADSKGNLVTGKTLVVELDDFERRWLPHPDPNTDLCILPTAPILTKAQEQGQAVFFIQLDDSLIPTNKDLEELTALENIIMIGYPSGIWDSKNKLPIIRRGITATHPAIDYEGYPVFMIDAACFPGSSGSPVFLFDIGTYARRGGGTVVGSRIKLLGTLYAGPQYTAEGEIEIVDVPTQERAITKSKIPLNLGLVVKSRCLLEFDNALKSAMGES